MFSSFIKRSFVLSAFVSLAACSSHPVLPKAEDIKVSREAADSKCKDLGSVTGRSRSSSGTTEEALEDMKKEAVRKGANFVRMETIGALSSAVRGTAYFCP